jgi:hypothetical protein
MAGIQLGLIGSFPTPVTSSFESIATLTASGGESFLSFTSIPSTYASIQIRGIGRFSTSTTANYVFIRLNNDTAGNYTRHRLYGDGTSAIAQGTTGSAYMPIGRVTGASAPASTFGAAICDIHNYASTTQNKTMRAFGGTDANTSDTSYQIQLASGLWLNTAAVNRVDVYPDSGTWSAGSTFSLYGIKGA